METIDVGDLVLNLNGRDAGGYYLVLGADGAYLTLADGRSRKLEKPKRKKAKHVRRVFRSGDRTAVKLRNGERVTNAELRRAIEEILSAPELEEVRNLGEG
jgi:ribosomal protein L14E/L6E/L27E